MAAAGAAFTMNGVLLVRRPHYHNHHRFLCLWKTINKHSTPNQVPSQKNVPNHIPYCLQSVRRSPSPHRNIKPLDFSPPTAIPPTISTIGLSVSPNLGIISWYLSMIKSRPILTKSITAALIYTVADVSSQTITGEGSERYDWLRTLRMAAYGMLIIGPSLHYWFNFASRIFPKRDLLSTVKKITLGQTVFGPTATAIFFSCNAALQGESGSEIIARLRRDLIPTLINGVLYWPACDFVTFRFIPVHLQPLVSNTFSFLWTVYLTYMASLAKATGE